jgi:TolB protein
MIAFTKIKGNQFYIGTMLTDGKNERILSSGYLVEGAKWSLSSRYLVYSKKKSKFGFDSIPKLYVVDVLTGYEFKLNTPDNEGATDPDWYQDL